MRPLEVSLINCKVELKFRWTKHLCLSDGQSVLSVAGTDNVNGNNDHSNIIFTIKGTKLFVPIVTLSAKYNQNYQNFSAKDFERSVYWNEYKTKSDNTNTTNKFRFFLESNFAGINRLFVLVYSNQNAASRRFDGTRYYF